MKSQHNCLFLVAMVAVVSNCVCVPAFAQTNSTYAAKIPAQSFLGIGGITTVPERKASPKFCGKEIPLPPQQNDKWTVPVNFFPPSYVSAVVMLFSQGLADPRGCEYREIEVGTGEAWHGDGGVAATHGWVLPGIGKERFAVGWNGLVYPVVMVGKLADLHADVNDAVLKSGRNWRQAMPERFTISHETCLPLKGCLLLRLGEVKLANVMWAAVQLGRQMDFNRPPGATDSEIKQVKLAEADPYLDWASDWAWGLFDRAMCAHMRGDDGVALASARLLSNARQKIEATAEARGYKRRPNHTSPWDGKYLEYVDFLQPLPALLADQERRSRRKVPLPLLTEVAKLSDQAFRISVLIEQLDEVSVRQRGQPGGLGAWEWDPVLTVLKKEGQAAIEPLLKHLENDAEGRLTRSVSFGRDFHRGRTLHSITQPLVNALIDLMEASYPEVGVDRVAIIYGNFSNADLAGRLRDYWKTLGQMPRPERWYYRLADDKAGGKAWADALSNIVKAENVPENSNETRLAGESLRAKTTPKVTELLVRRAEALVRSASNAFEVSDATTFILNAEKWEARPLLPLSVELQKSISAAYDGKLNIGSGKDSLNAKAITALAMLRARQGNMEGLDAYAQWIIGTIPDVLDDSVLDVLEPFWQFPKHPSLRTAARDMFGNPKSPWGTLAWILDTRSLLRAHKPLASPVLTIPEIRTLVLDELGNRAEGGVTENQGDGNLVVTYTNGNSARYGGRMEAKGLSVGAKIPFRRCDVVLEQLSAIQGFPTFSLLWPEPKRDEAVAASVNLLKVFGERLRIQKQPPGWSAAFDPPLVELPGKK